MFSDFDDDSFTAEELAALDAAELACAAEPPEKKAKCDIQNPAPASDPTLALGRYFGHDEFREGQRAVVEAVLAKKDVAVFWTTGSGKSLCYQLPSLHLGGGVLATVDN